MNKITELHSMPKGSDCEIEGAVTYEQEPKESKFGKGLNQFIVVADDSDSVGVNVTVPSKDDGFLMDETIHIVGKVDKYPDKYKGLQQDGTYPMKTSVKVISIERVKQIAEPGVEKTENVMNKEDLAAVNTPPTNGYTQTKAQEKEEEKKMWAKKDLIVSKQSACKTVGKWISDGKIELKDYFKWCTKLVDYFYSEDDKFAIITEANLIASGLVTVTKAEALTWIKGHMKGTDLAEEDVLMHTLHVDALDKQTLKDLLVTIEKLSLLL